MPSRIVKMGIGALSFKNKPFMRILIFLLTISNAYSLFAQQSDLAIGQWKSHLPYRQAISVTQSADRIFYATDFGVLALDKEDFAVEYFSKVRGLSNVDIKLIKYNPFSEVLMVVYKDGVIDLLRSTGTSVLNQIKNFRNILGEKSVNNVFMSNDSIVYLAASYGVSRLNIKREEFEFTTFTGTNVNDVLVYEDNIYAATDEGIYRVELDNPLPDNFENWEALRTDSGFPDDYSSKVLAIFQDQLYLNIAQTLYAFDGMTLDSVYQEEGFDWAYLSTEGTGMLAGLTRGTQLQGKALYIDTENNIQTLSSSCTFNPFFAVEDSQKAGFIWFADQARGFKYLENTNDASCRAIDFNTPYSQHVYNIEIADDTLWIASGGTDPRFGYLFRTDGLFAFSNNQWSEISVRVTPELRGKEVWDLLDVAVHPETRKVYGAALLEGLLEWDGENFTIYDDSNSSLNNAVGDADRTRVSNLDFDQNNNLWISNHLAERPISVLKNDGTWQSFELIGTCSNQTQLEEVLVDENGFKWFVTGSTSGGLLVYDTGLDLEDTSDDRCRLFTSSNSELPSNIVRTVAMDRDGEIWVGTSAGAVVFQAFDPFDEDADFFAPRTDQDENNLGLLLSSEDVNCIAIDGADRKWFGTTSGIFVTSPDGTEQIERFTADNSPLFDNTILDIAIHPATGEVFIGTASGLISYKAEATVGNSVNRSDAYAYPNPVRPDYDGPIAIKGLAEDANVKITDVNGQLIYETTAFGGQAIWDGNDYNGRRASTGIYLVFATNTNIFSPNSIVTKILFIN